VLAYGPEEDWRSEDPRLRSTHQRAPSAVGGFHGMLRVRRVDRQCSAASVAGGVSSGLGLGSMPALAARRCY
jgi:hypothetical protein